MISRSLIIRDLVLATRIGGGGAMAVGFFIIAAALYPLGVGPEIVLLRRIAPGVLWVSALLSCMLSLDRMFQADEEDGTLDLLLLSPLSPTGLILTKVLGHWLTTGLPLIIAAPYVAISFNLEFSSMMTLILSMFLGTPVLSLIGAVGAALTVGIRRGGMLMSLLLLPLYIPVLIFGAGSVEASLFGVGAAPNLIVLLALLMGSLALCPIAAASALQAHSKS